MKIVKAEINGKLQKNKTYSINKFVKLAGLSSRNTFRRYIEEYITEFNEVLLDEFNKFDKSAKISLQPINKAGIKLEGCNVGPLGLMSYPILPRFISHLRNRPKVLTSLLQFAFGRPQLFVVKRPLKDRISQWLLSQLIDDRDD